MPLVTARHVWHTGEERKYPDGDEDSDAGEAEK
jgi:hypothetical protein